MKRTVSRPARPKQLRAIQASRHLHTVPHKHTGHVLPRRATSYPVLAMIVLCVGVLLASWTRIVTADPPAGSPQGSYTVHVSVPGPAPSQPATIDEPANGKVFTATPITVSGSCPVNTYETLYRNSVFSGVALCSAVGSYSLQTDLFVGTNVLQVRDFSTTDVPGPLSNSVTVIYRPPAGSGTAGGTSGSQHNPSGSLAEPLVLKTNFVFQGYYTGHTIQWNLDIEGGTAPYAIAANWGDGGTSLISRSQAGSFSLTHAYNQAGGYKGSYPVSFTASDAAGGQTFLQLLTIVNNPPKHIAATTLKNGGSTTLPDNVRHILDYVWPSYGVVILLLTSFWLGERREYEHLKPRLKKRHA